MTKAEPWSSCSHDDSECNDHRMSDRWDEGFCCTLPKDHEGPHRDEGFTIDRDVDGRRVFDTYEWEYEVIDVKVEEDFPPLPEHTQAAESNAAAGFTAIDRSRP